MKIKDRAKPKTPPVEPGVYMAVCVGVIDLGEQYSEKFKSYSNKVKIVWAIPSETIRICRDGYFLRSGKALPAAGGTE